MAYHRRYTQHFCKICNRPIIPYRKGYTRCKRCFINSLRSSRNKRNAHRPKPQASPQVVHQPTHSKGTSLPLRHWLLACVLVLNVFAVIPQLTLIIILIDIIFFLIYMWGWTSACPRCHRHFAKELIDRTIFDTKTTFETTQTTSTHRDKFGNLIGTTTGPGLKPVQISTIQNHWQCKHCGYTWSGKIHDVR